MNLLKIISGGETGADRAALDWAISHGIPHGGSCPKGRRAEDGEIPAKYLLTELTTTSYPKRTEQNVLDSDGTLIITIKPKLSTGSRQTAEFARKHGKPLLHVHVGDDDAAEQVTEFMD